MILIGFFVFLAVIVVDFAWAKYIKTTAERKAVSAGLWAMFLYVLGGYVVTQYTEQPLMLIPASLGAFVGTYLGTKHA